MWTEGDVGLDTERFSLRPFTRSDAGGLLAHYRDAQVLEFIDVEPLATLAEAQAMVARSNDERAEGLGVRWGIRAHDGGRLIGTVGLDRLEHRTGRRGDLTFDLAVTWWGQGVLEEALPAVLAFGFESLGLRRIQALVTVGDAPSVRLLEQLAFEPEGRLRDHAFRAGRFWDQLLYGRLSS